MSTKKEQDEIMNNFLDVIKVRDCIRESREKRDTCKCKDCKNTTVIALYSNCHCQKMLLIIFTALLIGAVDVKIAKEKKKCWRTLSNGIQYIAIT